MIISDIDLNQFTEFNNSYKVLPGKTFAQTFLQTFLHSFIPVVVMKKGKLINPSLSRVVASLGHGQGLSICDCGMPIGRDVERIDLALTQGVPGFLETLDVVLTETCIEQVIIAEEFSWTSPQMHESFLSRIQRLEEEQGKPVEVVEVPHEILKQQSDQSAAVVRTGECTPYANVILKSGVVF